VKPTENDVGVVVVADDGIGLVDPPATKSHGVGLVKRLMEQIGGSATFRSDQGTEWTLRFPFGSDSRNGASAPSAPQLLELPPAGSGRPPCIRGSFVVPAQVGTQPLITHLGSRLRGNAGTAQSGLAPPRARAGIIESFGARARSPVVIPAKAGMTTEGVA
jgi:hypothetical protein